MLPIKRSLASLTLSLGLGAALIGGATGLAAANEIIMTQSFTPGTRTAFVDNLALTPLVYSHSARANSGVLTLTADDSSGSGLGWNVTIQSSAFAYSGTHGGSDIPAGNFSVVTAQTPVLVEGQAVDATNGPKVPISGATGSLETARKTIQVQPDYGMGTYTQALNVSLTIPASSKVGTYTGTLTTTISEAP